MGFAGTVARFAAGHLVFPTRELGELRVGSVREVFELIFVAVFTSVAADVVISVVLRRELGLIDRRGLRGVVVAEPAEHTYNQDTDQECFNECTHISPMFGFAIN